MYFFRIRGWGCEPRQNGCKKGPWNIYKGRIPPTGQYPYNLETMSFARLLVDIEPDFVSSFRGVDHESTFPTLEVVKRKWYSFLFGVITYLIFEKKLVDMVLQYWPIWRDFGIFSWFFTKKKVPLAPSSIAMVASLTPNEGGQPVEPIAYLDANRIMQFPDPEEKKRYENAMAEFDKQTALHMAQEKARLAAELTYLVQWSWELGTVGTVCFFIPDPAKTVDYEAIKEALSEGRRGIVTVVTGAQNIQELDVGSEDREADAVDGVKNMKVYIANQLAFPLSETFDLIISTSTTSPMVSLQAFMCQGTPLITPTARTFSRATFNEAIHLYSTNQGKID